MRKLVAFMLLCILIIPVVVFADKGGEIVLHVSPNGTDSNAGTIERPLKTLDGARQKVQQVNRKKPVRVIFHEGEYVFDKTVNFNAKDSGTAWAPVTYEAAENENVVFTGGVRMNTSKFTKVTDQNILRRLPDDAKDKVIQLDLKKQGINNIKPITFANSFNSLADAYVSFYLNGKQQMISQWPNGMNEYTVFDSLLGSGDNNTRSAKGGSFTYTGFRPARWTEADQWYIGVFTYDYAFERVLAKSVNPNEASITLATGTYFGLRASGSKRWKAFNLLEEIDIPTEWFLDRNNMILYYYPPHKLTDDDVFDMAMLETEFIRTERNASYITFKGIHFTKGRSHAININSDDITIDNCTFSYINRNGIMVRSKTVNILNNRFLHIDGSAIYIYDENLHLEKGRDKYIKNNYMYNIASFMGTQIHANYFEATNVIFENNTLHNLWGGAVITGQLGYENKIRYNEIYNFDQMISDGGALYAGRNYGMPGNEYAYNFLYDFHPKDKFIHDAAIQGIYMDDLMSGGIIHHNIIYNGGDSGIQIGGGQNNTVDNNIILDMGKLPLLTDNRGEVWTNTWRYDLVRQAQWKLSVPIYSAKYPEMFNLIRTPLVPANNIITNNIANQKIRINDRMKQLGTVENNIELTDLSDFVDPDNYDFRIKSSSPLVAQFPNALTEDNFCMSLIGADVSVCEPLKDTNSRFHKLYPQDKAENINAKDFILTWEIADTADEYKVTIASDSEMKDIVSEITVPYNYAYMDNLESGLKVYYWTVEAFNKGFKLKRSWISEGNPFSFTTSEYDIIDTEALIYTIGKAKITKEKISDGSYETSAIEQLDSSIKSAYDILQLKYGQATKENEKYALTSLNSAIEQARKSKIIKQLDMDSIDMFGDAEKWVLTRGAQMKLSDGEAEFIASPQGQVYYKDVFEEGGILSFQAKIFFDETVNGNSTWAGLEERRKDPQKHIWDDSGYLVVIKQNVFELQRYPGGILQTFENPIVKNGQWHDYAFGVLDDMENVRIIFQVDGQRIFDYTDVSGIKEKGYFSIRIPPNRSVVMRSSQSNAYDEDEVTPQVINIGELLENKDSLKFSATGGNNVYGFKQVLNGNEIINLDSVFNVGNSWQGLSLYSSDAEKMPWDTDNYLVSIRSNRLELRRYYGGMCEILAIADNNYIKDEQRVNIKYGVYKVGKSARIIFYADGNKVFDYMDENPIRNAGAFSVYDLSGKGLTLYKSADTEFSLSERKEEKDEISTIFTTRAYYSEQGTWSAQIIENKANDIRASSQPGSTAKWKITPREGVYKVYFWKGLSLNGDNAANIDVLLDYHIGREGDEELQSYQVDFSHGEAGWQYLCTASVPYGNIEITLKGNGDKETLAKAIKIVRTD